MPNRPCLEYLGYNCLAKLEMTSHVMTLDHPLAAEQIPASSRNRYSCNGQCYLWQYHRCLKEQTVVSERKQKAPAINFSPGEGDGDEGQRIFFSLR